jgi:hypothetical protein
MKGLHRECGPVAQLGARLNGIQEVTGSNPVRSTKPSFSSRRFRQVVESWRGYAGSNKAARVERQSFGKEQLLEPLPLVE